MKGEVMKFAAALVCALTLAALAAPAAAQTPRASQVQELANCAGAVAAVADFDVVTFPAGAHGEWTPVLTHILEMLAREPGMEGVSGRHAANAARSHWLERTETQRTRAAQECRRRYGAHHHG